MFTGIVVEAGEVLEYSKGRSIHRLKIKAREVLKKAKVGDSVSINGVCLTMVRTGKGYFYVEMMPETVKRSNLGNLKVNDKVNLEPALRSGDPLGGHLVSGHVEEIGRLGRIVPEGDSIRMFIETSAWFLGYVIAKGSVAVEGISLTVVSKERNGFWIALIPHTLAVTNLSILKTGALVNLEADLIGKYVIEGLKSYMEKDKKPSKITKEYLKSKGFC